jgi:hypothetical protein
VAAALAILAVGAAAPAAALADGTVTVSINGSGTVTGSGINCSAFNGIESGTCSAPVADDCIPDPFKPICHPVTGIAVLTATPASGFSLSGWSGCTVTTTGCSLRVEGTEHVTATFRDSARPTVALTQPSAAAHGGTIALAAIASDNVGVTKVAFAVRGVVRATDTSPPFAASFDTHSISDGAAAVTATAYDAAGNTTTSPSRTITVDNTPPSLTVAGPDGQTFGPDSTQRWTIDAADSSDLASLRCRLVPAAPDDCSHVMTISGAPEGRYTFEVVATDNAGNTRSVSRRFTIDATPPETTIAAGLDDGATTTATALEWDLASSEPGSTFSCRIYPAALTPGAFAPCSGTGEHDASGFAPGVYTFEVAAIDAVGNVDPSPAKRTFTVAAPQESPAPPASPPPSEPPAPPILLPVPPPTPTTPAEAQPPVVFTLAFDYRAGRRSTRLKRLVVKHVPKGATVKVRCKRGCARKKYTKRHARGTVSLKKLVRHKPLKVGTKIIVTVSKRGMLPMTKALTIRKRRGPSVRTVTSRRTPAPPAGA